MADTLRSDGKAVDVVVSATVTKGVPIVAEGWHGIPMADAVSGETVALEVATREHELTVDSSVVAAKGDILYLTSAGVIDDSSSGNRPFLKVTVAKDANNVVWGILLPQVTA